MYTHTKKKKKKGDPNEYMTMDEFAQSYIESVRKAQRNKGMSFHDMVRAAAKKRMDDWKARTIAHMKRVQEQQRQEQEKLRQQQEQQGQQEQEQEQQGQQEQEQDAQDQEQQQVWQQDQEQQVHDHEQLQGQGSWSNYNF